MLALTMALTLLLSGVAYASASCEINDGDDYTNSPYVTVSFNHGWNQEFRINDSSYFSTFDTWYAVPYSNEVDWDLGYGDGTKTVYMQFRENSDDTYYDKCNDSIKLDTKPPTTTASDDEWFGSSQTVTVTLSASDGFSGSGVERTEYSLNEGTYWTEYHSYSPIKITSWNQTLYYRSVDKAGNVEDARSEEYNVDLTGPSCYVYSNTVRRGRMGYIDYASYDSASPKTATTVTVATLDGAPKLVFESGFVKTGLRHWDFMVNLKKGKYRLTITGVDLAGNPQSRTGYAYLRVK